MSYVMTYKQTEENPPTVSKQSGRTGAKQSKVEIQRLKRERERGWGREDEREKERMRERENGGESKK